MGGNGRFLKLNFSFHKNSTSRSSAKNNSTPPPEYICPICNSIISDPVVVGSGHTLDRVCVEICEAHNFTPTLSDGTRPDFATKIPNLALKSAIPTWCEKNGVALPQGKDRVTIERIVKEMLEEQERENRGGDNKGYIRPSERFLIDGVKEKPDLDVSHAETELAHRGNRFDSSTSSEESVIAAASPFTPLPFKTRPACLSPFHQDYSSETLVSDESMDSNANHAASEDDEYMEKFKSIDPYVQEQGAIALRKATRNDEIARVLLCTDRLLIAIGSLLVSSYEKVQINAIAALVNLSLEKANKIKIVRSGIVPTVINLLKGRVSETQEHAAGLIFSLSLEEKNRTAIGVLGALPPLMNCLLRSESERTRSDSALALYNLSLDHSNRGKLVKLNAVPPLLKMLQEKEALAGRVLLVLYQLAASAEGKAAMLDANAVEHLVCMLRKTKDEFESESTRENCVAALFALSHGSIRFKPLAKAARAVEVLKAVEENGSGRAKEKAKRILATLKGQTESENGAEKDVDWEAILESGVSRTRYRVGGAGVGSGKTTEF